MPIATHASVASPAIVARAAEVARAGLLDGAGEGAGSGAPGLLGGPGASHTARTCARANAWEHNTLDPVEYGAPAWIDDLGLRQSDSPARAFAAGLPPTWEEPAEDTAQLDVIAAALVDEPRRSASLLALLVDGFGAWDAAGLIARGIATHTVDAPAWDAGTDSYLAASRIGTLLAIDVEPRSRAWFALAEHLAPTATDAALAAMRRAVADVKRLGAAAADVDASMARANSIVDDIEHEGERRAVRALLHNLQALRHVRAKERAEAGRTVAQAWEQVADDALEAPALGRQFMDEVRTQVLSNLAVVTGLGRGWEQAVPLFERGATIAATSPSAALRMETGCLLGLARYHAGKLEPARAALLVANAAGADAAAPAQHDQVRKLLALVEHDLGNLAASEQWLGTVGTS